MTTTFPHNFSSSCCRWPSQLAKSTAKSWAVGTASICTHMADSGIYSRKHSGPGLLRHEACLPHCRNDAILSCQWLTQLRSMLLHRYLHPSRRFTVAITCTVITLFHQVEGLVNKEAGGSVPMPILPNSDAGWFEDSATMSTLVTRSADDVVHDSFFIPTIATMGVLVIICIFCTYNLIVNRDTVHSRGEEK